MLNNKEINARLSQELFQSFEAEEAILDDLLQCKTMADFYAFVAKHPETLVRELCTVKITSSYISMDHFHDLKAIPAPSMFL